MTPSPEFSHRGFVAALLALGVAKALPLPMGLADIALPPTGESQVITSEYTVQILFKMMDIDGKPLSESQLELMGAA